MLKQNWNNINLNHDRNILTFMQMNKDSDFVKQTSKMKIW